MSRRRESGGMRHLRPRNKGKGCGSGEAKQLQQPRATYLFDYGLRRRCAGRRRILVPGGSQPIRCQGRWQYATDDPAKETPARGSMQTAVYIAHQPVNNLNRVRAVLRQCTAQPPTKFSGINCSAYGAVCETVKIAHSM